ncbi:MAG: 7-cyano-7-deazaguanine synthase [Proteobacteria bacterium]|nr:7-cyano-7-deazaguanine synthase [Pseudomonadota bacterium]
MKLLSGGVDSTACTHFLLKTGFDVEALFVEYGQRA